MSSADTKPASDLGSRFSAWVDDALLPVVPAERLAAVRIFTGLFAIVYLGIRLPALLSVARLDPSNFSPAGPARWLSAPAPASVVYFTVFATVALAFAFVAGFRFRISGPLFAGGLLWILAYRNSFGMIFHTENLLVMHVFVLSLTDSAAAWSWDARRPDAPAPKPSRRYGFVLSLLGTITVFAYVLAGIAKLRISGLQWATSDILRNQVAHDNLRKLLLGDSYSPLGAWAARHAWIFRPFAVLTLVVELLAPLALFHRRLGKVWVVVAWGFHAGVLAMMWILFPYQLFFVAFASFFAAERPLLALQRRFARARA